MGLLPAARIDHISITVYYLDPSILPARTIQLLVTNGSNQSAKLSWKANAIEGTTSVAVERSANERTWELVPGVTQMNKVTALYNFIDAHPLAGKSFYRLKMTTASGDIRYTTTLSFEQRTPTTIQCYPNPFTNVIQVTGMMAGELVTITDLYGNCLYRSAPAMNNSLKIDVSHLQPGMYVIGSGNRKIKMQKK